MIPASVSFSVLARQSVLFAATTRTSSTGSARIALPTDMVIPPNASLHVSAKPLRGAVESSSLRLPLQSTRCDTYLTLDRPVYRPGETVYFRSLTLLRRSLCAGFEFPIRFELIDPDGRAIEGAFLEGVTEDGVGNGEFVIPERAVPGSYKLLVKSLDGFFPNQQSEFQVRAYRVPKLKQSLTFTRPSYRPGDRVEAVFTAAKITGEPLADAGVKIVVISNNQPLYQLQSRTSSTGDCRFVFSLPKTMETEAVQIMATVDDQSVQETHWSELPLQLGEVVVSFYPEGGELVAGHDNRVYFTALDASGAPIHLRGGIVDGNGQWVTDAITTRDGMGRFSFRPERDQTYRLEIQEPQDVSIRPRLPASVDDLPVINTGDGVFAAGDAIEMVVAVDTVRSVIVRLACRGQSVGEQQTTLQPGENRLRLPVRPGTGGVVRATILDAETKPARPLVERLVFCRPAQKLDIEIVDASNATSNNDSIGIAKTIERQAGDAQSLTLQVSNERGEPSQAVLGVSVVDDAVWSLDGHDRPAIGTHFLLLSDVRHPQQLEDADFYLSSDPQAADSLDLLLGTQGWRRFLHTDRTEEQVAFRDQLIRLLELDGQPIDVSKSFDNGTSLASQWMQYRQIADRAWRRFLWEAGVLLLIVGGLWLFAFLIHRGRWPRSFAGCWLIALTTFSITGCAQNEPLSSLDTETDASAMSQVAPETSLSNNDGTIEPSNRKLGTETAPELVQWLDASKAAWLLRISETPDAWRINHQETKNETDDVSSSRQPSISDDLVRLLESRGMKAETLADQLIQELQFPIRQYAHQRVGEVNEAVGDYTETIYWQPLLKTDPSGRTTIRFDLPDSVTTFRLRIDGHTETGRLGSGTTWIVTSAKKNSEAPRQSVNEESVNE